MPVIKKSCKDIENTGTWIKYMPGLCDTCRAVCCTLMVEVTADDLMRLELTDAEEVRYNMKALVKRLKKDQMIRRYNTRSGKFVLQQKRNDDCVFLDDARQCIEYDRRPDVCRQHPEKAGSRPGYCPYIAK